MRISEVNFKNWWASPVGQEVRNMLRENILKLNDAALTPEIIKDQLKSAELLGRKLVIQELLNMSYKELMGEE